MNLASIKKQLNNRAILFSEDDVLGNASVIGYEKKFKWRWVATQLNTFIVVTDFKEKTVTEELLEQHLKASFDYASKNYSGWPRGFQSGIGVVSIVISDNIDPSAQDYCNQLKSGKKWAGFTVPVAIDSSTSSIYKFSKKPLWGRIYYPYFEQLINFLINKKQKDPNE